MKRFRQWILSGMAVLAVSALTLEILSAIVIESDVVPAEVPNYRLPGSRPFWVDSNPYFGMWHPANAEYVHTKSCFSVLYQSNSYGARDSERSIESANRRVIVIGDSFIEGYGLEKQHRTTDLLEAETGLEHLNFATSGHFGPTQYFLLYKHLAKRFRHDAVIISLLPDNDFADDDPELGKSSFADQYRPYFIKTDNGYRLDYKNKNQLGVSEKQSRREKRRFFGRFLRNFTYSVNLINYVKALLEYQQESTEPNRDKKQIYSGFRDFTADQIKRLEYVLGQFFAEIGDRPVIVMVIPRTNDLAALPEGTTRFVQKLNEMTKPFANVSVLDLQQEFRRTGGWQKAYRKCDDHWSPAGAAMAAEQILQHPGYQKFLNSN